MPTPNSELQGPENNPQNPNARAPEDRNPEAEYPNTGASRDAGKDSDQSTLNNINATVQGSDSSDAEEYGGPYVVGPSETEAASVEETEVGFSGDVATASVHSDAGKSSLEQTKAPDPNAKAGMSPSFEELDQIRRDIVELERLLVEAVAARKEADQEVLVRAEQESAFRAEAAARRREDEEARKRAEEKAARRRSEDDRKMAAEQLGRLQAELEAQRLAEEEERLRLEAGSLVQTSGEIVRQRAELEASEFAAAAEARRLEAENSLRKAEEQYNAELKRLRNEEESLQRATEEATAQRIEVEVQRREAETQVRRFAGENKQLAEAIAARDAEMQLLREAEAQARGEQEELHQQVEALLQVNDEITTRRAEMEAQRLNAFAEVEHLKEAQERMQATERIRREAEAEGKRYDEAAKNLQPENQPAIDDAPVVVNEEFAASASEQTPVVAELSKVSVSPDFFLKELRSTNPYKRMAALANLARQGNLEAFGLIAGCFDDPSPLVRNAAARALRDREPDRTVESFTRAIEEGSPERARNIGVAIASSGLASEALHDLSSQSREDTYKALSLLFVMAKTGEIQPLIQAIEEHPELEVSSAAVKLLNLSGQSDAAEAALQRRREAASGKGIGATPGG